MNISINMDFNELIRTVKDKIKSCELTDAKNIIKKGFYINPESAELFNLLGVIYELEDDHGKAMKMYRAALALNPSYKIAQDNLYNASNIDRKKEDIKIG